MSASTCVAPAFVQKFIAKQDAANTAFISAAHAINPHLLIEVQPGAPHWECHFLVVTDIGPLDIDEARRRAVIQLGELLGFVPSYA